MPSLHDDFSIQILHNFLREKVSIKTKKPKYAQGNVLSAYRKGVLKECQPESFVWQEQHLYGSSRLGLAEVGRNMLGEFSAGDKFSLYKGTKRYELTNHLGNVLSVVSDELTPNGEAQVLSATDYYPFGMSMPGRTTEG